LLTPPQNRHEHKQTAVSTTRTTSFVTNIVSLGYAGGVEADMYPFPGHEWLIVLVAAVGMPAMIFGGLWRRGLAVPPYCSSTCQAPPNSATADDIPTDIRKRA
jgi:hypothetical protein